MSFARVDAWRSTCNHALEWFVAASPKAITKQDLVDLGTAIVAETKKELGVMRAEMHGIRDELRAEFRAEIQSLRVEIRAELCAFGIQLEASRAELRAFRVQLENFRDELRAVGVQLEEIRSILRATGERQTNMDEAIRRMLNERDEEIRMRLDVLEATARAHSGILAAHGAAIAELREELERLGDAYERRERSPRVLAFEASLGARRGGRRPGRALVLACRAAADSLSVTEA